MKLLAFFIIALVAACVKADQAEMMKIIGDCQTTVGATDEDIASMMAHKPIENEKQKCMLACVFETSGIVKGGMISKDGVMAIADKMTGGDAGKMALTAEVYDECKDVTGNDKCDSATKQGMCMMEHGKKRGLAFGGP